MPVDATNDRGHSDRKSQYEPDSLGHRHLHFAEDNDRDGQEREIQDDVGYN